MFTNLLFLILALLLISLAPENGGSWLVSSPLAAFLVGLSLYVAMLVLIYIQNRWFYNTLRSRKSLFLTFVNIELLAFLAIYHFVLGAHRFFIELPFIVDFQGLIVLFSFILYLGGLAVFHYSAFHISQRTDFPSPCNYALTQLRMLFPFAIPFVLFTFVLDLLKLYPSEELNNVLTNGGNDLTGIMILFGITIVFMVIVMIFLPPLMQRIWQCQNLEHKGLQERLEQLCQKAHFKHAGLKTWTVMDRSLTAAIIGVAPPFRYVMFTKRLIRELPLESIEAILAHEIGHSYRKHLLLYPFIIFGMMVTAGLFSLFFSDGITQFLALQNMLHPSILWDILYPFAIFVPYACIIAIYFRIVFGYFSRLFERQADLHVFHLGIPPEHMVDALDHVATASGQPHDTPSWHHYSVQQRIDFLTEAKYNPEIIDQHHKRVKSRLTRYFIVLAIMSAFLFSPVLPETTPFREVNSASEEISGDIAGFVTGSIRKKLANEYVKKYQLQGNTNKIVNALEDAFSKPGGAYAPGVAEYYAANTLMEQQEFPAAAQLMIETWRQFDFALATPKTLEEFHAVTEEILSRIPASDLKQTLEKANDNPRPIQ